jgi:peptidoglycan/xylan/chitin deacetylase (PgdA/CDA1 family)
VPDAIRRNSRDYGRDHFESLFATGADPWDYSNDYESTKYTQTLSLVPEGVHAALELACAEGHFTERLATRVEQVVAADISTIALDRARTRCATHSNVSFMPIDLVADAMPGRFDLIVCSEVLYYAGGRGDLARVAAKLADALTPGGRILLAHAHVLADEPDRTGFAWALPYGAKLISDVFSSVPGLSLAREIRTPLYRIQLFSNSVDAPMVPEISILASTGKLPSDIAAHVREGGGVPPAPVASEVSTERLPILAYHRIAPSGSNALAPYRIAPDAFEEQLRYLKDAGYRSVGLEEWRAAMVKHAPLAGRCVLFTFDDGTRDFAEFAWPLLRKYGFGATLFVVAGEVGGVNRWDHAYGEEVALLNWKELRDLRGDGLEIGAHSYSHHFMSSLAPVEIVRESVQSRRMLLEQLGHPIRSFCYPYGDHDRVVRHLVGAAGFSFGLTCEEGRNGLWGDPMRLKRLTILRDDDFASFVRKFRD